ncbi:MAG: hypothetical protein IJR57_02860 [Ruminococcus sp.]|nr:hypothetical protein [Ruminococcus sp.]
MKRIISIIMIGLLVLSFAACSENGDKKGTLTDEATEEKTEAAATEATEAVTPMTGGWTEADSPVITDEVKALFDKLNTEQTTGVQLTPVAYLASQLVAGTNHRVLCKMTPTVPDAVTTYVLVTVYEDLEGHASVTGILESNITAPEPYDPDNPVSGGWGEPTDPIVTDDVKATVEKAYADSDGAACEPKALLGMQVVAGYNYKILCKVTPIVPDAEPHYSIVTIYADLGGNAEVTGTYDFTDK